MNADEQPSARARAEYARALRDIEAEFSNEFLATNPLGVWIADLDDDRDEQWLTPAVRALRSAHQLQCLSEVEPDVWISAALTFGEWVSENPDAASALANRLNPS